MDSQFTPTSSPHPHLTPTPSMSLFFSSPPPPEPKPQKRKRPSSTSPAKKSSGWLAEHDDLLLSMKADGYTNSEIASTLNSRFEVQRTIPAVKKRITVCKARTFEWSEELEEKLVESAKEFFEQKINKYNIVNGIFQGKKLGVEVKLEAVVSKLKALEKEGRVGKLS